MTDSLIIFVLILIAGAVVSLATQGLKVGKEKAKLIKNELIRNATLQAITLAETSVASLNQTVVKPLKESPQLSFDEHKQKKVKQEAISEIKKNLDESSKDMLDTMYGNIDKYLEDVVEAEVYKQKNK